MIKNISNNIFSFISIPKVNYLFEYKSLNPIKHYSKRKTINSKTKEICGSFIILFAIYLLYILIYRKTINIKIRVSYNNIKTKLFKESKVCICTLGKRENLYIREYIEHYLNYGVNKINICDNNDIDGEKFEDVIGDYIKEGYVHIINWRGKKRAMFPMMEDCYAKNKDECDWIMHAEIDEFIHLYHNYSRVSTFLDEPKFKNCQLVYLNLICHTDNGHLYYENKPLKERFPETVSSAKIGGQILEIKFIIRGHLENIHYFCVHRGTRKLRKLRKCNGFGHQNKYRFIYTTEPDTKYYYYDHYYGKSTEEFIKKVMRGDALHPSLSFKLNRIGKYFNENELTLEKILLMEKWTGYNLSFYKEKLKMKN